MSYKTFTCPNCARELHADFNGELRHKKMHDDEVVVEELPMSKSETSFTIESESRIGGEYFLLPNRRIVKIDSGYGGETVYAMDDTVPELFPFYDDGYSVVEFFAVATLGRNHLVKNTSMEREYGITISDIESAVEELGIPESEFKDLLNRWVHQLFDPIEIQMQLVRDFLDPDEYERVIVDERDYLALLVSSRNPVVVEWNRYGKSYHCDKCGEKLVGASSELYPAAVAQQCE